MLILIDTYFVIFVILLQCNKMTNSDKGMGQRQSVAQCARSPGLLPKKESIAEECYNSEASDTIFHLNAMILHPVYVGRNRNRKES